MSIKKWAIAIGCVVGLGCLQVAQRNALLLQGYALGHRVEQMHEDQVVLHWLQADVTRLGSPSALADAAQMRKWKFVAREVAPKGPTLMTVAALEQAQAGDGAAGE